MSILETTMTIYEVLAVVRNCMLPQSEASFETCIDNGLIETS